ncbi:MAG: 3'-5' exonuclease [Candidatus Tectomicrobia bacterium]|nr:3'-5' exonuclease [Candidatus Tectomicrobia bacterium]
MVEVSIIRIEPGREPRMVLDSLVNPSRRMAATEIHGITDADVAAAPRFEEIAGNVVQALQESVVAAYNVYFDIRFLQDELQRVGLRDSPPHLCLMYLRPMIGLGGRCSLDDACQAHGIPHAAAHQAAADAAAAHLWGVYLRAMTDRRLRTFGDLAKLKAYKFIESFHEDCLGTQAAAGLQRGARFKTRGGGGAPLGVSAVSRAAVPGQRQDALHGYWEALKTVLSDLEVSEEELALLVEKKKHLGLTQEEVRSLHARAFADVISTCIDDKALDADECELLRRLYGCLKRLGWAPGE